MEVDYFIVESELKKELESLKSSLQVGWGNGYIVIGKDHPAFGLDYDQVHTHYPQINVHGGLTFCSRGDECEFLPLKSNKRTEDYWVFGFDTAHVGDDESNWPEERVLEETKDLVRQFSEMERRIIKLKFK